MDGGSDVFDAHGAQGRHRKGADVSAWTPTLPVLRPVDPERTRHVAPRSAPSRSVSGELFPKMGASPRRAVTLDNSIADTDIFPNLRRGRHAVAPGARPTGISEITGSSLEPVPVLAPVEYDQPRPAEITDGDGDMVGLRKFNLGTVPASVTPPKSWRKAAWFSVVCSAAALAALVSIASVFVRHDGTHGSIDALPGLPPAPTTSGGPDGGGGPGGSRSPDDVTSATDGSLTGTDGGPGGTGPDGLSGVRGTGGDGFSRPGYPGGSGTDGVPLPGNGGGGGQYPPPAPSTFTPHNFPPEEVIYGPNDGPPVIDGSAASNVSHTFYYALAENPDAALASTAMTRAERRKVRREYADVERIQVTRRVVYRSSAMTRNTLILYKDDGSTEQVTRTLYFSPGADDKAPEIIDES